MVTRTVVAFVIAPLVPVALFAALAGPPRIVIIPIALLVAYGFTLFLAAPYVFYLEKRNRINAASIIVGASVLTALHEVLSFALGWGLSGYTTLRDGGVDLVLDGRLTAAGYLLQAQRLGFFLAAGALGGVVFWLIARSDYRKGKLASNEALERSRGAADK